MIYKIFCTFCLSPVEEGDTQCKVCGASMKDDPGVEMTEFDYVRESRKPCIHCETPIINYAVVCFNCKKSQENE